MFGEAGQLALVAGPQPDHGGMAGEHERSVADRLAAGELHLVRAQDHRMPAELEDAGLERRPRARRRLVEDQGDRAALERPRGPRRLLEGGGPVEQEVEAGGVQLCAGEEVFGHSRENVYQPRTPNPRASASRARPRCPVWAARRAPSPRGRRRRTRARAGAARPRARRRRRRARPVRGRSARSARSVQCAFRAAGTARRRTSRRSCARRSSSRARPARPPTAAWRDRPARGRRRAARASADPRSGHRARRRTRTHADRARTTRAPTRRRARPHPCPAMMADRCAESCESANSAYSGSGRAPARSATGSCSWRSRSTSPRSDLLPTSG